MKQFGSRIFTEALWERMQSSEVARIVGREIDRLTCPAARKLMDKLVMLQDRTSSVRRDEALVIATIACLDMAPVVRDYISLQDDAMKTVWLMIGKVHHTMIFFRSNQDSVSKIQICAAVLHASINCMRIPLF
jgi:hypothetical protein